MTDRDSWLPIGSVARPFGVRGELALSLINPNTESLRKGVSIRLSRANGTEQIFEITGVKQGGRVALAGISSRDETELWRQAQVSIKRCDLPAISPEELYLVDLLDASVTGTDGRNYGAISGFSDMGPQLLAEIKMSNGELIDLPFVFPLVQSISVEEKTVIIDPPEGLFPSL